MFDRFTKQARKVVTLAQDEAGRFNHDYVGTEHLLLGLMQQGDGVAARALSVSGVTTATARDRLAAIVGYGQEDTTAKPFTPHSKKVLAMASEAARRLGDDNIDTEHLLLALASEPEGMAARILATLEVSQEGLRAEVMSMIGKEDSTGIISGGLLETLEGR